MQATPLMGGGEQAFEDIIYQIMLKAKNEMSGNTEAYSKFKKACISAAYQENVGVAMSMIEDAIKNFPAIIQDLNQVLPPRFRIDANQLDMNQAVEFIHQVRNNATADIYSTFITTLKKHENNEISMEEMNQTIQKLLSSYPDLSKQFQRFIQNDLQQPESQQKASEQAMAGGMGSAFAKQQQKKNIKKPELERGSAAVGPSGKTLMTGGQAQQKTFVAKQTPASAANKNLIADDQSEYSVQRATQPASTLAGGYLGQQFKTLPKSEYLFFEKLRVMLREESYYDDIMKCFYCYVEGVFNQAEFFEVVTPLFDKNTEDLLNQFRTMIASRDNSRRHHNLLCKPFSEFDTSHFRKISYSYYEMPKDFPKPLCLGRQEWEWCRLYKDVFNEDYSSLPQGSESFKFKNKNQYEDQLFKVEDDIYKMDFENGNIFKTLKVLEEEKLIIEKMSQQEKEQYKLDPRKFNKLRLKQIEKIYGDLGQEMLRLLPINPVKAIPIISERFKISYQKNREEKQEMLRGWADLCEKNFYKSLDHRSFHFKAFEKKQQQAKSYVTDIKAIAAQSIKHKNDNQLKGGVENCEFYGTYTQFEKSICVFTAQDTQTPEIQSDYPINLSSTDLFSNPSILPQMRFLFNNSTLLSLALETVLMGLKLGPHSSGDKDKMRTSLKQLMQNLFGLNNFQELKNRASNLNQLSDSQIEFVMNKDYYESKVAENFSYQRVEIEEPDQQEVEGKDDKEDQEMSELGSPDTAGVKSSINKNSMSYQLKPLNLQSYQTDRDITANPNFQPFLKPDYKLMFTSQNYFVFLRQLYTIYERLIMAKQILDAKVDEDLQSRPHIQDQAAVFKAERYELFLGGVLAALTSAIDANKYEDFARVLFGQRAYLLFSFDKLVQTTAKQLLNLSNDETTQKSQALYLKFQQHVSASQSSEVSDHWHNESIYLANFAHQMQEVNSFSGLGIRLLFSPQSKILSIHCFNTNPYTITESKKAQSEVNNYTEAQVFREVHSSLGSDANKQIFLQRNKDSTTTKAHTPRDLSLLEMQNDIVYRVQPQVYRLTYEQEKEDVIIYKRKSALFSENDEFLYDFRAQLRYDDLRKRRFIEINGGHAADGDVRMTDNTNERQQE